MSYNISPKACQPQRQSQQHMRRRWLTRRNLEVLDEAIDLRPGIGLASSSPGSPGSKIPSSDKKKLWIQWHHHIAREELSTLATVRLSNLCGVPALPWAFCQELFWQVKLKTLEEWVLSRRQITTLFPANVFLQNLGR